jgi:hypothetical protein
MAHHHCTPRHLDDPVRPVFGLSIPQFAGAVVALLCGLGAWSALGVLPPSSALLVELRIFLAGLVAAAVFFGAYVLAGERTEPFGPQLWGYLRRAHRYTPSQAEETGRAA